MNCAGILQDDPAGSTQEVHVTNPHGTEHAADLLHPAPGCDMRSALATGLGARCTRIGTLLVVGHQQTSLDGLYAIGDIVSDLDQIAVGTVDVVLGATALQNRLPRNPR